MRSLAFAASLLAATSAVAQNHSPMLGATPDTLILSGGWELTPEGADCLLTHAGGHGQRDLMIKTNGGSNYVGFGILAPVGISFDAPVQLTVMAQAASSELVGRVTFKAVKGGLGTLLVASWPSDRLYPRLKRAERLNVFGPDQHLIRSVRLAGVDAAIAGLQNGCSNTMAASSTMGTEPHRQDRAPQPARPADVGWVSERDAISCRMRRTTIAGNEITFLRMKGGTAPLVTIQFGADFHLENAQSVVAEIDLLELTRAGSRAGEQQGKVRLTSSNDRGRTLLVGEFNAAFLREMAKPRWIEMQIGPPGWFEAVSTAGAGSALDEFNRCIRSL